MKKTDLERKLEVTLNNLSDISSNRLKAQSIVWTLEDLGVLNLLEKLPMDYKVKTNLRKSVL